jgi:coniferyl-aldehyde dehydrogenase
MKPSRRAPELLFLTNSLKVIYQPKGVVARAMAPWNFPVYLSVGPIATALAAGNRVMITNFGQTCARLRVRAARAH